MGFMDNFTSDSPVTVKQPDYYAMTKEAAKAELITNAVNAEVPGYYIQAMITGKKPDFLNTLDAEEEETGFRTEYEQITGAAVSIFEAWEKENGVESAADGLHKKYLLRFVHKDTQDGNIRVTIVGNNQAGFTIAFAKDSETVIDAEFKAQPMDKEGTLILYTEDIDKTE